MINNSQYIKIIQYLNIGGARDPPVPTPMYTVVHIFTTVLVYFRPEYYI